MLQTRCKTMAMSMDAVKGQPAAHRWRRLNLPPLARRCAAVRAAKALEGAVLHTVELHLPNGKVASFKASPGEPCRARSPAATARRAPSPCNPAPTPAPNQSDPSPKIAPDGASIYDAAGYAGISLPASCRQGSCTACCARLLSGAVARARVWAGPRHLKGLPFCLRLCCAAPVAAAGKGFGELLAGGSACPQARLQSPTPPATPSGTVKSPGSKCVPASLARQGYITLCTSRPTSDVVIQTHQASSVDDGVWASGFRVHMHPFGSRGRRRAAAPRRETRPPFSPPPSHPAPVPPALRQGRVVREANEKEEARVKW
jgi:ferredoxin